MGLGNCVYKGYGLGFFYGCGCAVSSNENERRISCNCACGEKEWDVSHLRGFQVAPFSDDSLEAFQRFLLIKQFWLLSFLALDDRRGGLFDN